MNDALIKDKIYINLEKRYMLSDKSLSERTCHILWDFTFEEISRMEANLESERRLLVMGRLESDG